MTERGARTLAQAKINLSLRVLDKEPDGFHSIDTMFLRLDLGDEVNLRVTEKARTLHCEAMQDQPQEENLAYRAAALYAEETKWPRGFAIDIKKEIPIGGGLGGGSADAAAVLRILNKLSPNPLPLDGVLGLAARLGSDVPFPASDFVMALATGRGEKLVGVPPLPSREIRLYLPPFGINTGEAYALLDTQRSGRARKGSALTAEMFADWDSAAKASVNDFEAVVRPRWPAIDALLARGELSATFYRMTGSGSTVFELPGLSTRAVRESTEPTEPLHPKGTRIITTRTSESVVPLVLVD
jgi:4-diphosphocytidyl-2-C-methyl-D-erythritol kinase